MLTSILLATTLTTVEPEHKHSFYEYHCNEKQAKKASEYIGKCSVEDYFNDFYCIYRGVVDNCELECYEDKE